MKYFENYFDKEALEVNLEQVVNMIRSSKSLSDSTMMHRKLLEQGQLKAAKEVKESTPLVAVSFNMEGGKLKENCRECYYQLLIDFDAKTPGEKLEPEELERVKTIMRTSNHTRLGYESISGLGYHAIVPFQLPEGISIDMEKDPKRGEEIFARVHRYINKMYSVWCDHPMDSSCSNVNRLTGLSHDPQAVYRPDAYPFCPTREELGIDKDGKLLKMKKRKKAVGKDGKDGNPVTLPLGDRLERAVRMVEEGGTVFAPGSRHDFVMRVSFILNRMGVDEEEAADALDEAYMGQMEDSPSKVLHSCYRTAADEFGICMPSPSSTELKTELIAEFLKKRDDLKYDPLTQKTLKKQASGRWKEMKDRDVNDLYMACCSETGVNLTVNLFETVLNSSIVPEVNPLCEYLDRLPAWNSGMPDYIAQAASMVHMSSPEEDALWQSCFKMWFVAMVAAWKDEDVVNQQVIVLVGKQGIYKSTWIRCLMPPELKAYVSDMSDVQKLDKDEQLRTAEFGLINLDELDKLSDRELNKLKSTITAVNTNVRAAYGRHKECRIRVASFAGSGNKEEFLTDQTGNRRWLPFHVQSIDSPFEHHMPYEGMYSQALSLQRDGFNYWFSLEDIQRLEKHQQEFMVPSSEEQLVQLYLSPAEADAPGARFITTAEIASILTIKGGLHKDVDIRKLGATLKKLGFEKHRDTRTRRHGYVAREHTPMEIDELQDAKKCRCEPCEPHEPQIL